MAYVSIKPIHQWEGKSKKETLSDVINYALDPAKTTFVNKFGEEVSIITTYASGLDILKEWMKQKERYLKRTGRDQGKKDILAYSIIQSFDPKDNVSPELAMIIGDELATDLTNGDFAFVVGTHLDQNHTHNHLVINSTAIFGDRKYRDVIRSFETVIMKKSNEICRRYDVSVIEDYKRKSRRKYIHWLRANPDKMPVPEQNPTWQNILRQTIDIILNKETQYDVLSEEQKSLILEKQKGVVPRNFDGVLAVLKSCGYEIKDNNRTTISVRAAGQTRFTRLKKSTLGEAYTKAAINKYTFAYNAEHNPTAYQKYIKEQEEARRNRQRTAKHAEVKSINNIHFDEDDWYEEKLKLAKAYVLNKVKSEAEENSNKLQAEKEIKRDSEAAINEQKERLAREEKLRKAKKSRDYSR